MADLERLAKAIHLDAEHLDSGEWLVSGGAQTHLVNAGGESCDCQDSIIRGGVCKHQLIVKLRTGDVETLRALRALIVNRPRQTPPAS